MPAIGVFTQAAEPGRIRSTRPAGRRTDDVFFSAMALFILGAVVLGFARSYYLAGLFRAPLPSVVIHVHAAVASSWILLFIIQTALISGGRLQWHKRLGILGAALAGLMVILGFAAATDSLARGFAPPGSKFDPRAFYAVPIFGVAAFCILIFWALRVRSDGPAHKRLVLMATIGLLGPPVSRWPFAFAKSPVTIIGVVVLFLALLAAFDLWSRRRIHRVTVSAGLFLGVSQLVMIPIGRTALWQQFASAALSAWLGLLGHS